MKSWSERQDLNLRRLGPKPSALARLSYAPTPRAPNIRRATEQSKAISHSVIPIVVHPHIRE